ncbi:MAG: chromate transporter [Chitinispirillales bacterium]|jgi:chromate transporter|nr:chromate transporter [Chitinispirillales bacterium]
MILLLLLKSFLIIGAGALGGGYAIIPMIEHEAVAVHGWLTDTEFAELIAIAQMVPGAIGVNAAAYTGFKVAGFAGSAAAIAGFTLPSIIFCFTLIRLLAKFGSVSWVETLKKSIQPAVAGLIIAAVLTYGKTAVADVWAGILAVSTFAILFVSKEKAHPVLLILCGGIAGMLIYR